MQERERLSVTVCRRREREIISDSVQKERERLSVTVCRSAERERDYQ